MTPKSALLSLLLQGLIAHAAGQEPTPAPAQSEPASQYVGPLELPDLDALLFYKGDRSGTFGPTGKRLFTERLEAAPGLRGQFSYVHFTPELRDLVRIAFRDEKGALVETGNYDPVWHPSHMEATFSVSGLEAREAKWITGDDAAVVVVRLRNPSDAPRRVRVEATSGFATEGGGPKGRFIPVDLKTIAGVHPFPGRDIFTANRKPPDWIWIEAERPKEQRGSTGRDHKRAASAGEVLGSDFGGGAGDRAVYAIRTLRLPGARITIRYARQVPDSASWEVLLDDRPLGRIECVETGGWGDEPREFLTVSLGAGDLAAGEHRLEIRSTREKDNVNFDGFFVHLPDARLPEKMEGGRFVSPPAIEEILYEPGRVEYAGVPFELIDPAENRGRGIVGLRGGTPQDPASAWPESIYIPLPPAENARLHLLGQIGHVPPGSPDRLAGEYVLLLDQGPEIREPLDLGRNFASWATSGELPEARGKDGRFVLSLDVPRGRRAKALGFAKTGGGIAALLLAATIEENAPREIDRLVGEGVFHGVRAAGALLGPLFRLRDWNRPTATLEREISLPPKASAEFRLALAFADDPEAAARVAAEAISTADPLASQRERYGLWYEANCPRFDCADPTLARLWWYRWFIVRHCGAEPRAGRLRHPCFFEGRHGGWYPSVITYSTPHIVAETRWLRDPRYAFGQVRAHVENREADGIFRSVRTDWTGGFYTDWIPQAAWGAYLVHPDRTYLAEVSPALAAYVDALFAKHDPDGDGLLAPPNHWETGMEWSPVFFHFNGYDNRKPEERIERPDFVAYHFGSADAMAEALATLGDEAGAGRMRKAADRIREAALKKLWDPADRFFYGAREKDDALARCREVVGFYPFTFGLPQRERPYAEALRFLVDPREFWSPFPVASAARSVPVFSAQIQRWPGPGGVTTACMWNGPTWPHANSLVVDALARVLREYPHEGIVSRADLARLLDAFTRLHFEEGDPARPLLREYADGDTGKNWGCPDYFHSTFNDLLIRHLGGLVPRNDDTLEIDPLIPGPAWWRFDRIPYRGHRITIAWDPPDGEWRFADYPQGFSIAVDGVRLVTRNALEKVVLEGAVPAR